MKGFNNSTDIWIQAHDTNTGQNLWKYIVDGVSDVPIYPAFSEKTHLIYTATDLAEIHAVDQKSGKKMWSDKFSQLQIILFPDYATLFDNKVYNS